ncbi:hypothetical protein BOTCAL_0134g00170 [Botryotinia calthae]|uniref:Uncharacterized protein n=1 Tax=Botryotinia calthae TaxID=38488 RepID=A0A4Y8D3Q2_9HELO|nr:hypothetical protein BOTCAL_0134g00170 [Botryotinia calthae]
MAAEDTEMGGISVVPLQEDIDRNLCFPPSLLSQTSSTSEASMDTNMHPPLDVTESTVLLVKSLIYKEAKKETNGVKPHPNSAMHFLNLTTVPQNSGVSVINQSNLSGLPTLPSRSSSPAPILRVGSRKSIFENKYPNGNATSEYDKLSAIIDRHYAGLPPSPPSSYLPSPITSGGPGMHTISSGDQYLGPLTISGRPVLFATLLKESEKFTGSSSVPPTKKLGLTLDTDTDPTTSKSLELSKAWRVTRVCELMLRAAANIEPGNKEGRVEILDFYLQEYPLQRLVILKALENTGRYFRKFSKAMSAHSSKPYREQCMLSDHFKKDNPIPPIIRPLLPFASIAASYVRKTKSPRRGGTSSLCTYKDHHYHNNFRCEIRHENESFPFGFNTFLIQALGKCSRQRLRNERYDRHKIYMKQVEKGFSHVHKNPFLSEEIIKECGGETYAALEGRVEMDDLRDAAYWEMTTRQIEGIPTRKNRNSVFKKRPSPLREKLPILDDYWIPDSVMPHMKVSGQIIKLESEIVRASKRKQDADKEAEEEEREVYESRYKARKIDSKKVKEKALMAQWEREFNAVKKQIRREYEKKKKEENEEIREKTEQRKAIEERERPQEAQEKRSMEKKIQREEKNERLRMERERARVRAKEERERRKDKRDLLRWENRERSDCRVTQAWIDLGADMARVGSWD